MRAHRFNNVVAVQTQADRLSEIYADMHGGKEMPKALHDEVLGEEIDAVTKESLPKLSVVVKDKANLVAQMPAAIFANETLYYFELACTSSATAHAFAGAIAEHAVDAHWKMFWPELAPGWIDVEVSKNSQIQDCRLAVPGYSKNLHHVAVMDRSGELFVADNDDIIWQKLRARMTCPTLEAWGAGVMPRIKRSGILIETKSIGIQQNLNAYILAPDAVELFDQIIGEYVRSIGGF